MTTNANSIANVDDQPVTYTRYQEEDPNYARCEMCNNIYPLNDMCENTLKPDTKVATIALSAIDKTLSGSGVKESFPEDAMSLIQSYLQPTGICVFCDEYSKERWADLEEQQNNRCSRCGAKCDIGDCDMCDHPDRDDDDDHHDDGYWDYDSILGWRCN